MKKEIPVFFSTDDNYIPYLDVAISSLIANASEDFRYRIIEHRAVKGKYRLGEEKGILRFHH